MPGQKQPKKWIVTASGDRPLGEITKALKAAGFEIGQVFEEIGSISGTAEVASAAKLRAIRGVADVSPDEAIDIGPPGSEETW